MRFSRIYRDFFKPLLDFFIALLGFVILLPIFFTVILALFIFNRRSVFFLQPRPGYRGNIFEVIKFKTMSDKKDADGKLLPDSERLTPLGNFIRKTSLDEIPQLINILKGEMSLVGPRPLLVEYLPLYNTEQLRRMEVRPGITGWAQVNGRNALRWQERFKYDVWYVDNLTLLLDIKIIWITFIKVFKSEGINSPNSATMEKFTGNN